MIRYAIEGLVDGVWAREHVGATDDSTLFDSRNDAIKGADELTHGWGGWYPETLRVVPVQPPMFLLLLKTESPGETMLQFVGIFSNQADCARHIRGEFGTFREAGHGSKRMLEAIGNVPVKSVLTTQVSQRSSYLLAEY